MEKRCEKCGRDLPLGGLRYVVKIEAYADFDGYLGEEDAEEVEARMRELVERLSERDPGELEREVYEKQIYLLCKDCRDHYLANPLNLPLPDDLF